MTAREALKKIRPLLDGCVYTHYDEEDVADILRKVDAILASPPRNCDRFGGDPKRLHTAWFDWTDTPSGQNADGTAKMTFGEWLLAPADSTQSSPYEVSAN